MPRRLLLVLAILGLGGTAAAAQPGGTVTSFSFLRIEPSARAAALAGAFGAVEADANALFYNPARPDSATGGTVSFSYLNHLADIDAGSVAYSHAPAGGRTRYHGGVRFAHWGTFEQRNEFGEQTGTFGAQDVVLTLGAARQVGERGRYGANLHVIHSSIAMARATAVAADLGGTYRFAARRLTVGAALRNVGTALSKFGVRRPRLPTDLRVSVAKRLAHLPVLLTATAYDLTNLSDGVVGGSPLDHVLAHLSMGAELRPVEAIRLRVGYNHRRGTELALTDRFDFAGVGLGFGVNVGPVAVDYAYSSWSELGGLHQFTVRADVGAL